MKEEMQKQAFQQILSAQNEEIMKISNLAKLTVFNYFIILGSNGSGRLNSFILNSLSIRSFKFLTYIWSNKRKFITFDK